MKATDIMPMLADAAPQKRLVPLCVDPGYAAEQKLDGIRGVMEADARGVFFWSRTGKPIAIKLPLQKEVAHFAGSETRWILDGEVLAGKYYVFDVIRAGTLVNPGDPWHHRRLVLEHLFENWNPDSQQVILVPSFTETEDKGLLAKRVIEAGGEGVMFKKVDAPYQNGKRSSAFLKVKFTTDVDCVVTELGREGKANMALAIYRDGTLVEVGECSALSGDKSKIKVGDVVAVKILYVSRDFRLVQPTLPRIRDDKRPEECTWDQLPPLVVNKAVLL